MLSKPVPTVTLLDDPTSYSVGCRQNGEPDSDGVSGCASFREQSERGFRSLSFESALERRFRAYLRTTARTSRLLMLMLGVPALAFEPLIDRLWLSMPTSLLSSMMLLDWLVILPALIITAGIVLWRNASPIADWGLIAALFSVGGCVLAQRVIGLQQGFDVPLEMACAPLLAVLTLGRIPFRRMLGVSGLFFVGLAAVELVFSPSPPSSHFHVYSVLVLLVIGLCAGYSLEYSMRWNWLNSSLLRYMARYDGLTGLLNRPTLEESVEQAHGRACRDGRTYALALVDVDRFGEYNDHYGHQAGDAVLGDIGRILAACARRPGDVCGRYGGEEFLILWADTTLEDAEGMARQLREHVAGRDYSSAPGSEHGVVTVSVGMCYVDPRAQLITIKHAIASADRMLYAAKSDGRDRTRVTCGVAEQRPAAAR